MEVIDKEKVTICTYNFFFQTAKLSIPEFGKARDKNFAQQILDSLTYSSILS